MPTLTQTLRAKQKADRAAIVAQRKLEKAIAAQEKAIESLKAKLRYKEAELEHTRRTLDPLAHLVEDWRKDQPVVTEEQQGPPPVLDTDMVYMQIFHSSWEKGKSLILPVSTTGREPHRYRDDGEYQLHSGSDDWLLQDDFFMHYQQMWKHQRIMLGYHMFDTYWGRNVSNGSWKNIAKHKGGYCTRPQDQVLVKKGTRGGRYRSIGCYKEYEGEMRFVSDWDHTPTPHGEDEENSEYRYLYDLRGDALIAALDALILGEEVMNK